MPSRAALPAALLALAMLPPGLGAQEDPEVEARYVAATAWVHLVAAGEFKKAAEQVNEAVSAQLGATQLEAAWAQLGPQLGELNSLEPKTQVLQQGYHVVILEGLFAAGTFDVQVVMGEDQTVSGFFVRPPSD